MVHGALYTSTMHPAPSWYTLLLVWFEAFSVPRTVRTRGVLGSKSKRSLGSLHSRSQRVLECQMWTIFCKKIVPS